MFRLDHLVIAAETLGEGTAYVEDRLGVTLAAGGQHVFMGTHNRVLSLGPDVYLEVIAIDPDLPAPGRVRWFGLDDFSGPPRLVAMVEAAPSLADLDSLGATHHAPETFQRGDLTWHMALPRAAGVAPVLHWPGPRPQDRLPDIGLRVAAVDRAGLTARIATPGGEVAL